MRLILALSVLITLLTSASGRQAEDVPPQEWSIEAVGPPWTLRELMIASEFVAVVEPTGPQREHWNSSTGRRWESDDERLPLIYRDEEVRVLEVLKGAPPAVITIRNIGGEADGMRLTYEGLFDLTTGSRYLVFLETVETPTHEGFETAVSFVAQGHGLFQSSGDAWTNSLGVTTTTDDLRDFE